MASESDSKQEWNMTIVDDIIDKKMRDEEEDDEARPRRDIDEKVVEETSLTTGISDHDGIPADIGAQDMLGDPKEQQVVNLNSNLVSQAEADGSRSRVRSRSPHRTTADSRIKSPDDRRHKRHRGEYDGRDREHDNDRDLRETHGSSRDSKDSRDRRERERERERDHGRSGISIGRDGVDIRMPRLQSYKQWILSQPDNIDAKSAQEQYEIYRYNNMFDHYQKVKSNFEYSALHRFFDDHKEEEWFREKYDPLMLEVMAHERAQSSVMCAQRIHMEMSDDKDKDKDTSEEIIAEFDALSSSKSKKEANVDPEAKKEMEKCLEVGKWVLAHSSETVLFEPGDSLEKMPISDRMLFFEQEVMEEEKEKEKEKEGDEEKEKEDEEEKEKQRNRKRRRPRLTVKQWPPHTVYLGLIPLKVTHKEIFDAVVERVHPNPSYMPKLILSEPKRDDLSLTRMGWAKLASEYEAQRLVESDLLVGRRSKGKGKTQGQAESVVVNEEKVKEKDDMIDDDFIYLSPRMAISRDNRACRVPIAPSIASTVERMKHDIRQARLLAAHLDKQVGIESNPLIPDTDAGDEGEGEGEGEVDETQLASLLDALILYLREVHTYCYYCATDASSMHDLERICGPVHLREPSSVGEIEGKEDEEADKKWASNLDNYIGLALKSKLVLIPHGYELSEVEIDREIETAVAANIYTHQQGQGAPITQSECELCHKRFTERKFVEKHLRLKHPQLIIKARQNAYELKFFKNYSNDPRRHKGNYSMDSRGEAVPTPEGQAPNIPVPPSRRRGGGPANRMRGGPGRRDRDRGRPYPPSHSQSPAQPRPSQHASTAPRVRSVAPATSVFSEARRQRRSGGGGQSGYLDPDRPGEAAERDSIDYGDL